MLDSRLNFERASELSNEAQPNGSLYRELHTFDVEARRYELGQWVDVKDTIDQWLEAQIIDIREDQVFVHYNGWGSRWDEWMPFNSPRIALFRSYTVQNPKANYLSPCPNVQPDSIVLQMPPSTQLYDMNSMLTDMVSMMSQTQEMIRNF